MPHVSSALRHTRRSGGCVLFITRAVPHCPLRFLPSINHEQRRALGTDGIWQLALSTQISTFCTSDTHPRDREHEATTICMQHPLWLDPPDLLSVGASCAQFLARLHSLSAHDILWYCIADRTILFSNAEWYVHEL